MNTLAGLNTGLGEPIYIMEVSFPIQVKEEWSKFLRASFDNNVEKVTKLLENDSSIIDEQDANGTTALMIASDYGYSEIVKKLLKKGAKIDLQSDTDGASALILASQNGHSQVVELLLKYSAQIDMLSYGEEWSALMVASQNGHDEVIKLLLKNGVHVNLQNHRNGTSALMLASQNGHSEVVKLLLEKDAEVNIKSKDGWSALMLASQNGHHRVVKMLLEKGTLVDIPCNRSRISALMVASQNGHVEVVKLLLEKGAQIDDDGDRGRSPLMLASQEGHNKVVKLLLEKGAQVNIYRDRVSALMIASQNGHGETVKLLLEKGALIDMQSHGDGWTALMLASQNGHSEVVKILLVNGAQVDMLNGDRRVSALTLASQNGHNEVVQLLHAHVQIDMSTDEGKSILMPATQKEEVQFLQADIQKNEALLNKENSDLRINADYPGIYFFKMPITKLITSSRTFINKLEDIGISILIPENSLKLGEGFNLSIHSCFSGPFVLPDGYESASPAYLITHSKKVTFLKDITVQIRHYACLRSDKDCKDMAFFSSSSILEHREPSPIYHFKKIQESKEVFRHGDQKGEISIRHFCFIKIGKRTSQTSNYEMVDCPIAGEQSSYSIRLYRNLKPPNKAAAVFCVCLSHPLYTQHCDDQITCLEEYKNVLVKQGGKSDVNAKITSKSEEIIITAVDSNGWNIGFDKRPTKISIEDIHLPERLGNVSDLHDYPPKFMIHIQSIQTDDTVSLSPKLKVGGLDKKYYFELLTPYQLPTINQGIRELRRRKKSETNEVPLYYNDDETNECEPSPQPNSNVLRLDDFCKQVLLILHVVNEKEATAATRFIKAPNRSSGKAIYYRDHIIGMFAGKKIALVQTRPGGFCEQDMEKALQSFPKARYIIGVGVCYAYDRQKHRLGDVLISQVISDFRNFKFSGDQVINRGETKQVSEDLSSVFCKRIDCWKKFRVTSNTGRCSKPHFGKFACVNALFDSLEEREKFRAAVPEVIGGEMEGCELLKVMNSPHNKVKGIIIIKGVADYGDGTKSKEWQFTAAMAAFDFTRTMIRAKNPPLFSYKPHIANNFNVIKAAFRCVLIICVLIITIFICCCYFYRNYVAIINA